MLANFDNPPGADPSIAYALILAGLLADHVLVACRLLGLLVTIPGLNGSALSWPLKCLLLLVTAAMITPNVSRTARVASQPLRMAQRIESGGDPAVQLASNEGAGELSSSSAPVPSLKSGLEFLWLAACETCLGLMLGLGANLILQGFRMAGQLIDQQAGWSSISATPLDGVNGEIGSAAGEFLFWTGTVTLFILGGHLLLISTLLQTFRTFPPGCGDVPVEVLPLVTQLVQQSLSLALQLSAPVWASQVLAGLVLSHAVTMAPQFQQAGTALVVRVALATVVLLLTLGGVTERMLELIPASIPNFSVNASAHFG